MLAILPTLLAIAPVAASHCAAGTWDLQMGGRTMFRFEVDPLSAAPTATWERPRHFALDGDSMTDVAGPVIRRSAKSVSMVGDDVEISFDDPEPNSIPDVFRLHCVGTAHLAVSYHAMGYEPFDVVRAPVKPAPLGPWDASRRYDRSIDRPTNAEMTAIFDADQADRQAATIDWSVVGPADDKRRARTAVLLDSGALQSGDDFYHAAFLFQHGGTSEDYLKAHLLATIAAARGKPAAVWIAAATLDRYLQSIGKPQVLGTQYTIPKDGPVTQDPYDRTIASDAMRMALRVPPLAEQEQRRQRYAEKAAAAKKP